MCGAPGRFPVIWLRNHGWRWQSLEQEAGGSHLRSAKEVTGYYIEATDGDIGHVEDFVVDDGTWEIRYMVVDTKNWWPGKKVLVAPEWIERVSWEIRASVRRRFLRRDQERARVRSRLLNRDYEERLYKHYDRPGYWLI